MKYLATLFVLIALCGCTTTPYGYPFGIVGGGVRMPNNVACRISDDGKQLLACNGSQGEK